MYIDLQKAFDTVNRKILLKKLDRCGIRGIMFDWIQDYLCNRQLYFPTKYFFFSISSYMWGLTRLCTKTTAFPNIRK